MPYTKTIWANGSGEPIDDSNLNNIEQGIEDSVFHADSTHAPTDSDNTANNETSHSDVVVDSDFTANGVLNRTSAGAYSILVVGTDIQAHDADTTKNDVANTFTEAQRTSIDNTQDNSIAFNDENNFRFTATAAAISVTSQTVGQSGAIVIDSANLITGWGTEFDWGYAEVPTDLTGTENFSYFVSGASGVDSIIIGRV